MNPEWEYAIVYHDMAGNSVRVRYLEVDRHLQEEPNADIGQVLAVLGQYGWELTTATVSGTTESFYFKRRTSGWDHLELHALPNGQMMWYPMVYAYQIVEDEFPAGATGDEIARVGALGWEMVGVSEDRFYFKRPTIAIPEPDGTITLDEYVRDFQYEHPQRRRQRVNDRDPLPPSPVKPVA